MVVKPWFPSLQAWHFTPCDLHSRGVIKYFSRAALMMDGKHPFPGNTPLKSRAAFSDPVAANWSSPSAASIHGDGLVFQFDCVCSANELLWNNIDYM